MKPYLALFRAGANSLHPAAVARLHEQNFDYALSWFGAEPPQHAEGAAFVHAVRGPKWDGLAQTIREHWDAIQHYRYVWLPDDDLLCVPEDISRMFAIADELQLELAQPALTPDSYATHLITLQHSAFQLRFTNFVEIMAPLLSADMLARAYPTMVGQVSGYGLDSLWPRWSSIGRMAIIDDTPVLHTRPVGGPNHVLARQLGGLTPGQEAALVLATHGIESSPDFQINYGGLLQSGDPICIGQSMAEANAFFEALMQSLGTMKARPVAQVQYLAHHHRYLSNVETYQRNMVHLVLNRALKHTGIRFPSPPKEDPSLRHPTHQLGAAVQRAGMAS